jgi:hypothetical protein
MKMKSAFISSIFNGWAKKNENVVVFATYDVIHGPLNTKLHLIQLECDYRSLLQIYM